MSTGYIPALGIATGVFEVAVAWTALRLPANKEVLRPVGVLLLLLAGYQFLEVLACGTTGAIWPARLAFMDIVWLPPVGVWLTVVLSDSNDGWPRRLSQAFFAGAGLLTAWVAIDPQFVSRTVCSVVIARYTHPTPLYSLYAGFYQAGLATMMIGATFGLVDQADVARRRHLADLHLGTLGFVVPALLTQVLMPDLIGTMPSVMCHYALVLAVFLARIVQRERAAVVGEMPRPASA